MITTDIHQYIEEIVAKAEKIWQRNFKDIAFDHLSEDPLVKLLLIAQAFQNMEVQHEIDFLESSIVRNWRNKILPYHLIKPVPSFSVIQTALNNQVGTPESEMLHQYLADEKVDIILSKKKYHFVPFIKTKIVNAEILKVNRVAEKSWDIEINWKSNDTNLAGMSLFFPNMANTALDFTISSAHTQLPLIKNTQYDRLDFTSWFNTNHLFDSENPFLSGDITFWQELILKQNIQLYYIGNYDTHKKEIPIFDEKIFLRLDFDNLPAKFDLKIDDVLINCIPVVNVEMNNITLRNGDPIQPLSKGKQFLNLYFENADQINCDKFSLRNFGIERFNPEELLNQINRIVNKYTTDYYAFKTISSLKGNDKIQKLHQSIIELKEILDEDYKAKSSGVYAILKLNKNLQESEFNVPLSALITDGEAANNIEKDCSEITISPLFDKAKTKVLLSTFGGKNEEKNEEKINEIHQYYCLTQDKLYTLNDIKSFCIKELGVNQVLHVEIEKNIEEEPAIWITIKIKNDIKNIQNIDYQQYKLQKQIELRSVSIYPVKIKFCN